MKTKRMILALISIALIAFTSCEKDDLGDPVIQLEFKTVTSEFTLKNTSVAANNIKFDNGHIILESVEFELESDTDSLEMEFEIDSYITVDFATGETNPDLSFVRLRQGTYTEMELEIELWDQTDQPAIVLTGSWEDEGGTLHPVRLEFDSGQSFSVEIEGDFVVDENTSMVAEVTLDPGIWFSGVANEAFSSATKNNDGVIVISSEENEEIYDTVEDMIDLVSEVEIEM
ncbi:MAG: hypothetical protein ACQERU_14050 [Bacteroidota bacterium]